MKRKGLPRVILAFLLIAVFVLVTACGNTPPKQEAEAPGGTPAPSTTEPPAEPPREEITISLGADFASLDPLTDAGRAASVVQVNILDTLVRRDDDMNLIPWLATEWKALDDYTWEFKLREGVKFSNGEELDANAVKYTFDQVLFNENSSPLLRSWFQPVSEVKVIDKYTVQLITSEPYPLLMAYLPNVPYILPPQYYSEHGLETGADSFARKPVGSGPYTIAEWVPDTRLVLQANEDYWNGAPKIKKITMKPITEMGTRLAEFLTGGVDLIQQVAVEQIPQVEATDFGKVAWTSTVTVRYINLRTDKVPDRTVRQALFYATDVDTIIENLFGGYGEAMKTGAAVIPAEFGYDPTVEPYPYDPDKARQMLDEDGWKDTDGDGIREKDGKKLHFNMAYIRGNNPRIEDVGQAIASQWSEVGVSIELHPYERGRFRELWFDRTLPEETYMTSTGTRTFDADSRLINMVHSYVDTPEFSAGIVSFYSNPEIDDMIVKARTTTDMDLRKEIYSEILHHMRDEAYMLSLFPDVQFYALNKCLQGWNPRVDAVTYFGDAYWECPK